MIYDPSRPPKITISEAITHHTANLGVGIPDALRVVAIGLADIVDSNPGSLTLFGQASL